MHAEGLEATCANSSIDQLANSNNCVTLIIAV